LKDIFDVQDEIARAIADRLRITIAGGSRLVEQTTTNIEAYELLLKGRAFVTRRGRAVLDAIPLFERAIALDPNLGEAHALLGDTYRLLGLYGMMPSREAASKARASVERALAIEPGQAEALATLGNLMVAFEWRPSEARAMIERALARDPSHVRALAESAVTLATSRAEPSTAALDAVILERIHRARTIDPLNAWVMAVEAFILTVLGRPADALEAAERSVATDPNNFTAHWTLVFTRLQAGRLADAQQAAEVGLAMSRRHPIMLAELATVKALSGDRPGADAIYRELIDRTAAGFVGSGALAVAATAAGRVPAARQHLAQAIADHDPFVSFYKLPVWQLAWADAECLTLLRSAPLMQNMPG
jgi:tetratricopeptide (TPR) repeat protein